MEQLLAAILAELVAQWQWDIDVMSQPWMYWALLIPICVYVPFFFMKWAVLTTPAVAARLPAGGSHSERLA